MKDNTQDIKDLLTMFHDFEIVDLYRADEVLTFETIIPWGELWDIENYKLTFKFNGCKYLRCTFDKRTSDESMRSEKGAYYPTVQNTTDDIEEIKGLGLDIQRHGFATPNTYTLYCNGFGDGVEFGSLEFTADSFQILDNQGESISLDKMKNWATDWWTSIEEMWKN